MLLIIIIAAIALALIISNWNKSRKNNNFDSGDKTVKISGKSSFLAVIGLWLKNIMKGK